MYCFLDMNMWSLKPHPVKTIYRVSIVGVSLSEPHINVLNTSSVCMYVCMYICIRWITIVVLWKIWKYTTCISHSHVPKVNLRGSCSRSEASGVINMAQLCSQSDPRKQLRSLKEKRRIEREGKRVTIRLVITFELTTYVTRVGGACAPGVYSHSSDLQRLSS